MERSPRIVRGNRLSRLILASYLTTLCSGVALAEGGQGEDGYSMTLQQLGRTYPMSLRGVESSDSVPFDVRSDQVVTGATLELQYSYSPALLPDLSQINILVNDEVAASLALPKENAGSLQKQTVQIPPQLVTEFNRLSVQLIGHYTMGCEDPQHTSLWAKVGNASRLTVHTRQLALPNDLSILPLPFFDRRDARQLNLPFSFASAPDNGVLEAAGALSSWFGALATYRGAVFPAQVGTLPARGNGVVLVTGDQPVSLGGLEIPASKGPTLRVMTNPNDANGKLLVLTGRDASELKRAAAAIAVSGQSFAGDGVVIEKLSDIAARKPYDAPNWLSTERPIKLGELIAEKQLKVSGYDPGTITIPLNLPPDLFSWREKGARLDLKYRYTPQPKSTNSSLIVSMNDGLLKSEPLPSIEKLDKGLLALIKDESLAREMDVTIPLKTAALQSRLQLRYMYDYIKQGDCADIIIDNMRGIIDPDSTLDLTGYDHFIAMPNLGVFKDAGFPFTRMADLSETAVVLPDNASMNDLSAYLTVLGRFGASTGYPALRVGVTQAAKVSDFTDRDLLVLASGANQPLLKQWADRLPAENGGQQRLDLSDLAVRVRQWISTDEEEVQRKARLSMVFSGGKPVTYLTGFESPLKSGRSVVVIAGGDAEGLTLATDALASTEKDAASIQGSLVVIQDKAVQPLIADEQYYVGSQSLLRYLQWTLSRHVGLTLLLTALGVLLLSGLAYMVLRSRARQRLGD